ncbi:MAG TPA: DUF4349 domain-containing protein, partial [Saprospiraceae bacterium]|nr:DUF4349 domain-containing protein [Saprospiraceae bacterium]
GILCISYYEFNFLSGQVMKYSTLFAAALAGVISACSYSGNSSSPDMGNMAKEESMDYEGEAFADQSQQPTATPEEQPSPVAKDPVQIPRQIIKTADYRIQVKDVNKSAQQAQALATRYGGVVTNAELNNSSYEITNRLTIRVPAGRFDSLLNDLGQEAMFTQYKRVSSQDVTEEYVDISIRLQTKKEVRDRYVDILRDKAKTVEEVLKAEEQIRVIQEEIEAQEGRLRFLQNQVAMSTINLELFQQMEYQPEPNVYHRSFGSKLMESLQDGWSLLQELVLLLIRIWPLLLIGGLIWWRRRWIWKRSGEWMQRRKKE